MKRKGVRITRFGILLAVFLGLAAMITTSVVAYYVKNTGEVKNTFSPASSVNPGISETFDGNEKQDVSFDSGGTNYPVFVRAAIVVTWKDKDGCVYFSKPVAEGDDKDYTLELNLSDNGWVRGDDEFYYYTKPVENKEQTDILIISSKQLQDGPEGYTLSVEIIAQTIQAVGWTDDVTETPAYKDAWSKSPEMNNKKQP